MGNVTISLIVPDSIGAEINGANEGRQTGQVEMAVTRTHLVYRVELWDSSGAHIVDLLAEVRDLQVAMDTYRSAVRRCPGGVITLRQGARIIEDSRDTRVASWADKGREGGR